MNAHEKILNELARLYPDAKPALEYRSPYELLVAVILSAQCTDERVNKVTKSLFVQHNTPETMLRLSQAELERYIYSCGFYRNKAAHILSASHDIVEKFGGEVPSTLEELQQLAGVGRKTANVVYSVAFGGDAIAVDTHVFRVANRLGLAEGRTPLSVEEGLMRAIPKKDWAKAHHWLIYHGRRVCHSQRPSCNACTLADLCMWRNGQRNG
ncbi:MAG: endonuclease III [Clostridia bacterium]|nr:endonuclease III [Clostridia bacterium]